MKSSENQATTPLSLMFLKSIVVGMGIVLVGGFTLVVSMVMLGMKYFTDVRSCDSYPIGEIFLTVPNHEKNKITKFEIDCGIIKAYSKDKIFGFDSHTGKSQFTIHLNE
jgi:hypothetical protein